MKVLICSDSHMRVEYFQAVMELEKPEFVIFAGDHSTEITEMSYVYDKIPFKIVRGNTDYFDNETKDNEIFEVNNKKILLTHGHLYNVKATYDEIEKKAKNENVDLCIFGHTHREYEKDVDGIKFLNPGALCDRKYVIFEDDKFISKKI